MKSIKVTVYVIAFILLNVINSSSTTILDNEFVTDELTRPEISIGKQKDEVFFADRKPTKVSEEDVKWMKMVMQKYWTYLRSSNVSIDGKGYSSSWAGFYDKEIYINWRAEVAWSSIILYNDGRSIVELRYFKPNNKISLIESKIKLKCSTCIQAGNALLSYAEEWKKPGNPDSAMGQVSTVIGEFLSFVGFHMTKAKVEFSGKRANRILKQQTDTFKGLLQESLFSNKWYLIQYNLSSSLPDKLIRMELEGNSFVPWKNRATTKKQKNITKIKSR
ncbi:MAG: hypothetical protein OMM_00691 [Candidatus Magnetoglobus multicellularis str. Araruama]|uniref:Uncharacterized protein n=1 Tax=Candidatus Magnetoglobus multicellularis str. Araruama TaxID=890399 RepID=A0A1V1PG94_9BACT|nr:MAG: hypothetical protein OMM_00691 [Candidatus Magnetoglobus multicellularis str. Araruama]